MSIRRLMITLALLLTFTPTVWPMGKARLYKVNVKKSTLLWSGEKKIGEGHQGRIKIKGGTIHYTSSSLFTGEFVVDMKSIICHDITDSQKNSKLLQHLRSKDFFYVKKYPTAKFIIQKIEKSKKKGHYIINGKITIRGKTDSIKFPAVITSNQYSFHAKGIFKIDRAKFDVKYNSGTFYKALGDKLINDEITLDFEIYAQ